MKEQNREKNGRFKEGHPSYSYPSTKEKISIVRKGKHHSLETKQKISNSHIGKICSEETKKKIGEGNKGKNVSEETRRKVSQSLIKRKERLGYINSPETRKKMSESHKGKPSNNGFKKGYKMNEEHRKRISKSHLGNIFGMGNKGKKRSIETRKRLSESHGGNGIPTTLYPQDWKESLKESIILRDNYLCRLCGLPQYNLIGRFKKLDVHHIDYNKNNLNPNNLITLCKKCHPKTNINRIKWINYFKSKI